MFKLAIASLVGATALLTLSTAAHAQYQGDRDYYNHGSQVVTCASHKGQYNSCRLPIRGNVHLVRQLSRQACVPGRSWGQKGSSRVWVSRGCRATFAVRPDHRRDGDPRYSDNRDGDPRYGDNRYGDNGDNRYGDNGDNRDNRYGDNRDGWTRDSNYAVDCRADGSRNTCAWDSRYGDPYLMRTNSGSCVEGRDWGYTSDGRIWVDEDCNARFGYRDH
jgi:hypothetical protein